MKKIFIVLLLVSMIFLTACGRNSSDANSDINNEDEISDETNEQNEAPIDIEEVLPKITILDPDSIGTIYMEATYTNNTEYPITGYDMEVLLKDNNETTYLSTYDTVLPGETSPIFESFGPETQEIDDCEFLKLQINAQLEEGKVLVWEYDFKLDKASWWDYEE